VELLAYRRLPLWVHKLFFFHFAQNLLVANTLALNENKLSNLAENVLIYHLAFKLINFVIRMKGFLNLDAE